MDFKIIRDKVKEDDYMLNTLVNMFERREIRDDHPLQRNPGMWTNLMRDGFIATIAKGEKFDSIKICEQIYDNGVVLWLIDGKHRLTKIKEFKAGAFRLGKNIEFPIISYQTIKKDENDAFVQDENKNYVYEIAEFDLRNKAYKDFPPEIKDKFDSYQIRVVKHLDCSDEEVGYHIRRYNRQSSMNVAQIAITKMDEMAKYIKDISENHVFFKDDYGTYSRTDKNKGNIDRVVSESIMAMFHLDNWKSNGGMMGAYLKDHSSEQECQALKENLDQLVEVVTPEVKDLFSTKNSFIWFTLFNRFKKYNLENNKFVDFLIEFKNRLKDLVLPEFENNSFEEIDQKKNGKDKSTVITKLSILESLMRGYFHLEDDNTYKENGNSGSVDVDAENLSSEDREQVSDTCEVVITEDLKEYIENFKNIHIIKAVHFNTENELIDAAIKALMIYKNVGTVEELNYTKNDLEDVELYLDGLNDWSVNVNNKSKIFCKENIPGMINIVAYTYKDEKIDENHAIKWFGNYVHEFDTVGIDLIGSETERYQQMKRAYDQFLSFVYSSNRVA